MEADGAGLELPNLKGAFYGCLQQNRVSFDGWIVLGKLDSCKLRSVD